MYLYRILAPIVRRRRYCAQVDILQNLKVQTISIGRFHVFRTWKEDQSLLSTKHLCEWKRHIFNLLLILVKIAVLLLSVNNDILYEDGGLYVIESNSLRNVLDIPTSTFLALAHSKRVLTILKYIRYY